MSLAPAGGGDARTPDAINFDTKLKTVTFVFGGDAIAPGEGHKLQIEYEGCMNNQMAGFYRSGYTDAKGEKRIMGSTQFEALDARRAFPCVDEPAAKAVFGMTLVVNAAQHAFSNMPEISSSLLEGGEKKKIVFMDSPKMSTYLLAWCVGEFDFVQGFTEHGVRVRVYTPPTKQALGTFALRVALATLDKYDDFFDLPYPLPKLDMVAVPEFAMGAMENWGLVTYRETALLYDEAKSSLSDRQRVAVVVAHELAHQWFGDLVTMAWWNDLWLNEGFASWMEFNGADEIDPKLLMWEQFLGVDWTAFDFDGYKDATHALHQPAKDVGSPERIEEMFDSIDYDKGASVIMMIASFINRKYGTPVPGKPGKYDPSKKGWAKGVSYYLSQHAYENAVSDDLWKGVAHVTGDSELPAKMASWTKSEGYPLVTVATDAASGAVTFTQKRFLNNGGADGGTTQWWVPLTVCAFSQSDAKNGITACDEGTALEFPVGPSYSPATSELSVGAGDCVKVNYGDAGFYRVAYSQEGWDCLKEAFKSGALVDRSADRAGLIDDVFALSRSNDLSTNALHGPGAYALEFAQLLHTTDETTLEVWGPTLSNLGDVKVLLRDQSAACQADMKKRVRDLVAKRYDALGWDAAATGETQLTVLLRAQILGTAVVDAADASDPAIVQATALAETWLNNATLVDANIANAVYRGYVRFGGDAAFAKVKAAYLASTFAPEKRRLMYALAATPSAAKQQDLLTMALDPAQVRSQDSVGLITSVARYSRASQTLAWNWAKTNWPTLFERYGQGGFAFNNLVAGTCGGFTTQDQLDDVTTFFTNNKDKSGAASQEIEKSKERIQGAINWIAKNAADVCAYLAE